MDTGNYCAKILTSHIADDIWDILCDEAEAIGYSVVEMLTELPMAKDVRTVDQFENFAVWFACEIIANDLTREE